MCDCKKSDYTLPHGTTRYNHHWSFGNGKLAKDGIVSFGIPAFKSADGFKVCPSASLCAILCYARQGYYRTSHVRNAREHNLAFLRSHSSAEFIDTVTHDVHAFSRRYWAVRIHDSGDFFDRWYLLAWQEIARQNRHVLFYGYTKMISWAHETRHLWSDNFRLVQSVGGLEDSLIDRRYPHSVIFPTHAALTEAGYSDASKSDRPAYSGAVKVGLVYHGSKKLTQHNADLLTKRSMPYLPVL